MYRDIWDSTHTQRTYNHDSFIEFSFLWYMFDFLDQVRECYRCITNVATNNYVNMVWKFWRPYLHKQLQARFVASWWEKLPLEPIKRDLGSLGSTLKNLKNKGNTPSFFSLWELGNSQERIKKTFLCIQNQSGSNFIL